MGHTTRRMNSMNFFPNLGYFEEEYFHSSYKATPIINNSIAKLFDTNNALYAILQDSYNMTFLSG